jgi:zinc/manganese transport system substrate-binding protein
MPCICCARHRVRDREHLRATFLSGVRAAFLALAAIVLGVSLSGCPRAKTATTGKKTIVATYSILGSVVRDLVGDTFSVRVSIPNGLDIHEWEPSARDIEAVNKADLVVENGLGLEGGMEKTLRNARNAGVRFFTATDHIRVRRVGKGEGVPSGDPDQAAGAPDPHFWTDPLSMKAVVDALCAEIEESFGTDLSVRQKDLDARLDSLDADIRAEVLRVPPAKRVLVTGHESLGYFAQRYGFTLIGAIVPSLTTQAEVSASDMAALKNAVRESGAKAVFMEVGTPEAAAKALARDAGAKTIALSTHSLPQDGSYFTFLARLSHSIVEGLQ